MALSATSTAFRNNETNNGKVNYANLSFIWTIHDFSRCIDEVPFLQSSVFPTDVNSKIKWRIMLSQDKYANSHINLYLKPISRDEEITARFKLSFLNSRRVRVYLLQRTLRFNKDAERFETVHLMTCDIQDEKYNDILSDDKLSLYCEISMGTNVVNANSLNNSVQLKISENKFPHTFKFFKNKKFTDVILNVMGREFKAHKVILAARSQVFSAMFKYEMEEKRQNRVEITDVGPEVFQEMLCYIYTGRSPNVRKMTYDLLVAADKYALEELKVMCEQVLFFNLSVETASDVLMVADMCNIDQLKMHTINFINIHRSKIVETEGWKNISDKYPYLVVDVFNASAKQPIPPLGPVKRPKWLL